MNGTDVSFLFYPPQERAGDRQFTGHGVAQLDPGQVPQVRGEQFAAPYSSAVLKDCRELAEDIDPAVLHPAEKVHLRGSYSCPEDPAAQSQYFSIFPPLSFSNFYTPISNHYSDTLNTGIPVSGLNTLRSPSQTNILN